MKLISVPYYDLFRCKAGDCHHNCCIGWEIDIDDRSLMRYMNEEGELGKELRANIVKGDVSSFCLDGEKRCHFLNENGLCELIVRKGESFLCEICTEHPRFYNVYQEFTERGVGLSCEAAAELILGNDESYPAYGGFEDEFLRFKYKMLSDEERTVPFSERLRRLKDAAGIEEIDTVMLSRFLSGLEAIDTVWTDKMKHSVIPCLRPDNFSDVYMNRFLDYLIFRQLNDEGYIFEQLVFCIAMAELMSVLCCSCDTPEDVYENCRLFSQEIEYSPDNMEAVFDYIDENYV